MTVDFADHFWGDRHLGFSIMYQNMKSGQQAVKEMHEYVKDRIQSDEEHNKALHRSFNKVGAFVNTSTPHNFTTAWTLARNTIERVQQTRNTLVTALQDIEKDVKKYSDELQKSQRKLKEQETFDAVNLMQTTTTCLQKAKETYASRSAELHKLQQDDAATPKELGKAEGKVTKAREEYRQYIEKYETVRLDFESKLEASAHHFQSHELEHIVRMKSLLANVARHIEDAHNVQSQVYNEFRCAVENLSTTDILQQFVNEKASGSTRPAPAVFEEPGSDSSPSVSNTSGSQREAKKDRALSVKKSDPDAGSNGSPGNRSKSASTASGMPAPIDSVYDLLNVSVPAPSTDNGQIDNLIHLSPDQDHPPPLPTTAVPPLDDSDFVQPVNQKQNLASAPAVTTTTMSSVDMLDLLHTSAPVTSTNVVTVQPTSTVDVLVSELSGSHSTSNQLEVHTNEAATVKSQSSAGSNSTTTSGNVTSQQPAPASSSTSALSSKLNLLIPGRRATRNTKSASNLTPTNEDSASAAKAAEEQVEKEGFWKKRRRNKSKSKLPSASSAGGDEASPGDRHLHDDTRSEASSRSDDPQSHDMPAIDEEGYSVRPSDIDPKKTPKWDGKSDSSDFSDSDEDEQTKKIKRLAIKKADDATLKASTATAEELRDAIGKMSLSRGKGGSMVDALERINEVESGDVDPWLPAAVSSTGRAVQLIRPALTGDAHLMNTTFAGFGSSSQTARAPLQPSLTGSTARARPRSNTPTSMFMVPKYASMDATGATGAGNPGSIHRADSMSSLDMNTQSMSGMSRGVSLTSLSSVGLSSSDVVPIAMAINETVHAWFSSGDPEKADRVRVFGSVFVSFPREYVARLIIDAANDAEKDASSAASNASTSAVSNPLSFRLNHAERVNALIPNKQVLSAEAKSQFASQPSHEFTFDAGCLSTFLKKERDAKPNLPFYNLEVLRYEVRKPVAPPLIVWSFWKCEQAQTDMRVDYKLNVESTIAVPLINLTFGTKIDGGVNGAGVVAKPDAEWMAPSDTLNWRLTELSRHGEPDGSLKARLPVTRGPSSPASTNVKFTANDSTVSGVTVELLSTNFKLSLLRRKVLSGKYFCDPIRPR